MYSFTNFNNISRQLLPISLLILASACGGGGATPTETPPPTSQNNDLTVTITGQGLVTSNPTGIDCESDCTETYDSGTQVTLTATSDTGFTFNGWSGACSGIGECTFDMSVNRSVSAAFIADSGTNQNTLTVTVVGSGSVTSDPMGIDCETDCTEDYDDNTVVTLNANPDSGFVLANWSGDCASNGSCVVTLSVARNVTATFAASNQSSILIENYSPPDDAFQLEEPLTTNASGVTWHKELQQYLVVRNGSAVMFRYDENFTYLGTFVRVENLNSTDTEGLAYVSNNKVLIVSEDGYASKVEVSDTTETISGISPESQRYRVLADGGNNGLEGIAVKNGAQGQLDRVYAVKEGTGGNDMAFVYFDMPDPDPLVLLDYQSNLTVTEPWDADQVLNGLARDLAGIVYDDRTGHVIIVSQESARAIQVEPDTGAIISTLDLTGAPQFEGVTIGPNGELVFVSEGNWIRIYTQD